MKGVTILITKLENIIIRREGTGYFFKNLLKKIIDSKFNLFVFVPIFFYKLLHQNMISEHFISHFLKNVPHKNDYIFSFCDKKPSTILI